MRLACAGFALVSLIAFAGCGDDDGDASDDPTKAEYIERGDEICQRLYEQRDPLQFEAARAGIAKDTERAAAALQNAADVTENRIAELDQLPKPPADTATLDELIERGETTAKSGQAAAEAVRADDQKALQASAKAGGLATARFNKAAIEYGFLVCGRGRSTQIG